MFLLSVADILRQLCDYRNEIGLI